MPRRFFLTAIFFAAFVSGFMLAAGGAAHAQQAASVSDVIRWQAKIEPVKDSDEKLNEKGIPFLELSKDLVSVETTAYLHYTDLQGKFNEKVVHATLNSKQLPVKEDGTFDVHFGSPMENRIFTITAINEKNKVFRQEFKLIPVDKNIAALVEKATPHQWRFSGGGGITSLSFRQRNVVAFNQMAITVKGSATYRLVPEKYDLGFSAFYNLVPIASGSPAGYKIRYLGINARVGYYLLPAPSPIRININAGVYLNTSFGGVGFENMIGPQLYPEFIYVFENGNSLLVYGKYSPALTQSTKLSFKDNREAAFGMHYSFPINFVNRMAVGIDISQLNLSVPPDWACTNTYSLSAGVSF